MIGTKAHDAASLEVKEDAQSFRLRFLGSWLTPSLAGVDQALRGVEPNGHRNVVFDLGAIEALDSAGAWLAVRCQRRLEQAGCEVAYEGVSESDQVLIQAVADGKECDPEPPEPSTFRSFVSNIGEGTFARVADATALISFLGETIMSVIHLARRPSELRPIAIVYHMQKTGLEAMPIVGLLSFLIGVVLAYQGSDQLARFGAQIFTVNLVGIAVLREMGVLITAIIVAGRSGSAFTAQIGTMKVNQEVDAMRTIGLSPMFVLAMPRVIALTLVMPLLTFYANILGLMGGGVMAWTLLDVSPRQFVEQLSGALQLSTFWVGMIKAPIFGFIIALVGCYEGLQVSSNAESVGLRTTRAVVESIFIVIVLDAMFSILFSIVGI